MGVGVGGGGRPETTLKPMLINGFWKHQNMLEITANEVFLCPPETTRKPVLINGFPPETTRKPVLINGFSEKRPHVLNLTQNELFLHPNDNQENLPKPLQNK